MPLIWIIYKYSYVCRIYFENISCSDQECRNEAFCWFKKKNEKKKKKRKGTDQLVWLNIPQLDKYKMYKRQNWLLMAAKRRTETVPVVSSVSVYRTFPKTIFKKWYIILNIQSVCTHLVPLWAGILPNGCVSIYIKVKVRTQRCPDLQIPLLWSLSASVRLPQWTRYTGCQIL